MDVSLYSIAMRFVGMKEVQGATSNPAILAMLQLDQEWPTGDHVPWCSAFVNYCTWLLDLPRSKSLMARSWLEVGWSIDVEEAARGDIVVLRNEVDDGKSGHVGLFSESSPLDREHVWILGGNQNDEVSISPYPIERILGVRRLETEEQQILRRFYSDEPFTVERDQYGFAIAIGKDGWFMLNLDAGTTRNELMVNKVVELLNKTK